MFHIFVMGIKYHFCKYLWKVNYQTANCYNFISNSPLSLKKWILLSYVSFWCFQFLVQLWQATLARLHVQQLFASYFTFQGLKSQTNLLWHGEILLPVSSEKKNCQTGNDCWAQFISFRIFLPVAFAISVL